jgi:hypothetical protein
LQQVLGIPVRQVTAGIPFFGRLAFGRNANVLVGWFSFFRILHGFWADEDVGAPLEKRRGEWI